MLVIKLKYHMIYCLMALLGIMLRKYANEEINDCV